ncbi:MAG: 50S ribosomal protein L31e [Candidatus Nitrosotenuis sp.]
MSQEAERVYTINLGKVWLSPNNQRAKRAINMIKEFATHHMKSEQIKIDQDLSQAVWRRGIRRPPRKIRVKMAKTDDGYVLVSTYEEEIKATEERAEEKSKEKKAKKQLEPKVEPQEPEAKIEEPKPVAKPEPKLEPKPKKTEKKPEETKKKVPKKEAKKSEGKKPAKKSK